MPRLGSNRIEQFRISLVEEIPRFPNNRESLEALKAKHLTNLLIDYANWKIRYIPPRPRNISIEEAASEDARWEIHKWKINSILAKAERGQDLTAYLSDRPHTRGFSPASARSGPDTDRWVDKDMLLNVMGYYHLHLDALPNRTNEILFANVTRDTFTVVGIFDHTVFENFDFAGNMSRERERLFQIFDERSERGIPPGTVTIPAMIATSGHPVYIVRLAMEYTRVIRELDAKLSDSAFLTKLYDTANLPMPRRPRLRWHLYYLSLGLIDPRSDVFFELHKGPN